MKTLKSRFTSLWLCLACQQRISCCLMKYNSSVISSLWLALLTVGARSIPWEPFYLYMYPGKGWLQGLVWEMEGAFHLVKISGISGSVVNGTRFVGSSHWKISKKVVPFSRLEFPNGMSCSIYVSRSLYQFQVHGRAPPRTGLYDQMEQLFTNRKFHFCYHPNFRRLHFKARKARRASRFSRVGWFSRALAFRSLYYPGIYRRGKMGTTRWNDSFRHAMFPLL